MIRAALPALGELAADLFIAAGALPGLLDGTDRGERAAEQCRRLVHSRIVENPELEPTLNRRDFTGCGRKVFISHQTLDAVASEDVVKMGEHKGVLGAVYPFHRFFLNLPRGSFCSVGARNIFTCAAVSVQPVYCISRMLIVKIQQPEI